MTNIAIHGAHDANLCFTDLNGNIRIYEFERFAQIKGAAISRDQVHMWGGTSVVEYIEFLKKIRHMRNSDFVDICYYNQLTTEDMKLLNRVFNIQNYKMADHHRGHSRCAIHQSPFDTAIVYSFDGGGHGSDNILTYFNVYIVNKNKLIKINTIDINFGAAYANIGNVLTHINKCKNPNHYSGKLMGMAAYGTVINTWIPPMINYYYNLNVNELLRNIGATNLNSHTFEFDADICATSQFVFQKLFKDIFMDTYRTYENLPVCLTGGCALNISNNQMVKNIVGDEKVFVPPNPNDAGLSYGYLLDNSASLQKNQQIIKFSGMPLENKHIINNHTKYQFTHIDLNVLCERLKNQCIIAIARGNSECGPRALGNRSIICYPTKSYLKDHINNHIKFRESFRPFAPVVLECDKDIFFENAPTSPYMSFSAHVKNEYKNKLPTITHIDGTARIQTVTNESSEFLFKLLTHMKKCGMIPILLNTSLNIKGKPIINDVRDILNLMDDVPINHLIIDDMMTV